MKKIVAALLLATISLPTLAQDRWVHLGVNDDFFHQYDSKTLKRQGSKVYVWLKMEYRKKQTTESYPIKDYWSSKQKIVINCSNETMQHLAVLKYAGLETVGEVVASFTFQERPDMFSAVVPDTTGEAWVTYFCRK